MKKTSLFCLFILQSFFSFSQHEPCKTMDRHKTLMQSDENYRIGIQNAQRTSHSNARTEGVVYRIPVVIHVMHLGTAVGVGANISNDQIYSAIESLNNAYRKKAGTWGDGNGADAEIEFCLAQKDPSGMAHNGINRINASSISSYLSQGITDANELSVKALSRWTNTKYYNIWIVTEIDNNNGGAGTQGYAYFPGTPAAYDGAVMLYNAFGFDPDGSRGFNLKSYTNYNATAIHEIGHALDLYHTFQGDGSGSSCPTDADCGEYGDCVGDTPRHMRSNSDCIVATNPCTGGSSELFIHNYMDYSGEDCQNEFTAGQVTRMRATLNGGSRAQLVTNANLIACGCSGNTAPITFFTADNLHPCGPTTIQFTDASLNFPVTWTWSFPGGTPSTSTLQNPSVSYNGVGPYDVTLTTFSTGGQFSTVTKTSFLNGPNLPFEEDFEGSTFPPGGWTVTNPDMDITWSDAYAASNTSAFVACYDYNPSAGQTDDLITPLINLDVNTIENPVLSFKVSYQQYQTANDTLDVSVSTDCGASWTSLYRKYGSNLQTTTSKGSSATPTLDSHWRLETIDLNAYMEEVIQFRFRSYNDYGADIFLDNVSVNGTILAGIQESVSSSVQKPALFPNPASQQISFRNISAGTTISLVNQLGELVKTETVNPNENIDLQGLSKGLYVVLIQSGGKLYTEKLMVQP